MKIETIAVHGGYTPEPTTKAVAVPIYQTTSYAFDSTQHGADLFDLKVVDSGSAGRKYSTNGLGPPCVEGPKPNLSLKKELAEKGSVKKLSGGGEPLRSDRIYCAVYTAKPEYI